MRKTFRMSGKPIDCASRRQANSFEKLREEPSPKCHRGWANLDLLGEPPAAQNPRVDLVQMIRRGNEENVILRRKVADFDQTLFHKLNVVLVEQGTLSLRQQAIDLIKEDDRRAIIFRALEYTGELFD
jgi:hypothetical protein